MSDASIADYRVFVVVHIYISEVARSGESVERAR